ncbi:MAG: tRNA (adenosine(37)-N6)-threonylcarbamoyltransferase complex transferase subunit TsaD [Alphaproteobacteria bacterium]
MIVLGIETSCDETSVSLVERQNGFGKILAEQTLSQIPKHKKYGGVVPELASREHSKHIDSLFKRTLKKSKISLSEIDAFAATTGPGLLGALLVGTNYAKSLAITSKKPFFSVNHLQAHVLVSRINNKINFPFLCLLVSGGHCQILLVLDYNKFKVVGETLDDAVGEVFDKTARALGYSYPGGPIIENLAKKSKGKHKFKLPKPLLNKNTCDLSFSGLKTSVRRIVEKGISKEQECDLAFSFQNTIAECLLNKVDLAIKNCIHKGFNLQDFVLSGGVASNSFIRHKFKVLCKKKNMIFYVPDKKLCVDNATMIAWAALEMIAKGRSFSKIHLSPNPRWRIDSL